MQIAATAGSSGSIGNVEEGDILQTGGGGTSQNQALTRRWSPLSPDEQDLTRHVLQHALDQMQESEASSTTTDDVSAGNGNTGGEIRSPPGKGGGARISLGVYGSGGRFDGKQSSEATASSSSSRDGAGPPPTWAQSLLGVTDFSGGPSGTLYPVELAPQLQPAMAATRQRTMEYAEPLFLPKELSLISQEAQDVAHAQTKSLPPLQSVMELTTAFRPPDRGAGAPEAQTADIVVTAGRALADGVGILADGTRWEKKSGVEYGKVGDTKAKGDCFCVLSVHLAISHFHDSDRHPCYCLLSPT